MRALSLRQAAQCENATHTRCRCRCKGAYHGANRVPWDPDLERSPVVVAVDPSQRRGFEELPEGDPHKLPAEKPRRRRPQALPQEELAL